MVEVALNADTFLKFNKTLVYENMIILKIIDSGNNRTYKEEELAQDEDDSPNAKINLINILVLLDNTILKIPLEFMEDATKTFQVPNEVEEIKKIYQSYLVTLHEYSLRSDTLSDDEKLILGLLKGRIAFYSNTIKQLDLLSQINL
jgi:hypothetical protein